MPLDQSFEEFVSELGPLAGEAPFNVVLVRRTDSTNRLLRRVSREFEIEDLPVPAVALFAWEQSAGRGRHGRGWVSPPGLGVYVSLLVPLDSPERLRLLPLATAVGLCRVVDEHVDGRCSIKWPNDLIVGGRKLAGILVEARTKEGSSEAIVGFGVNHGHRKADLVVEGATSLRQEGSSTSLAGFAWELVEGVRRELRRLEDRKRIVDAYRERVTHEPGDHLVCRVSDRVVEGRFAGIDDDGSLRVATEEGEEESISAGEIVEA